MLHMNDAAATINAMTPEQKLAKIEASLIRLAAVPDSPQKRASVNIMNNAIALLRRDLGK
jgi:hypothetical protein